MTPVGIGRFLTAILGLGLWAGSGLAQPAPVSGQYGALTLAVADGVVSGVFSEGRQGNGTEAAPQFTCVFLLRGRRLGNQAQVETWYPGDRQTIPGGLTFVSNGASLTLRENHGGCVMTSGDMVRTPFEQALTRAGPGWIGATLVTAPRAAFHPTPGGPAPRRPYAVRGDVVAVLQRRTGWVRASYLGGGRPVTGWLRAADLAPETPPGTP